MFLEKYVLSNNHEYILYNISENLKKNIHIYQSKQSKIWI